MKYIKTRTQLFEQFANEGMMSTIDAMGQEAQTREEFKSELISFLKSDAADPAAADDIEAIDGIVDRYFDEEGNKI
jgi:hypothetical protein